ncbi:MAG: hypothetical protein HFH80_13920 [Lachnospiraceae bacterium]|nr:hypothetical protein [Lachnospiraceae bacterium]
MGKKVDIEKKNGRAFTKIISFAMLCCTMVLTFALIPVNIFCVNFPEWITVLLSVFCCCGLLLYLTVFKTKTMSKIILPLVFGLAAIICSFVPYLIPYWNSFTFKNCNGVVLNYDEVIPYEAAAEDLNALMDHLKKVHPMFRDGLTEDVKRAYLQALERLETAGTITINDLRREIQIVLHPMHDAHTSTYNNFPNDKYLKTIPQKSHEGYNHAPFLFEWTDGENVISEVYSEEDFVSWSEFLEIRNQYVNGDEESQEFVSYEIDQGKSLAILTLTQCKYNQTYINCIRSMFVEVMQKGIQNVAVDLRGNGGGSSLVGNEFIKYLPVEHYFDGPYDWRWGFLNIRRSGRTTNRRYKEWMFDGNVYILTDRESFSSAKDFAMLIQDNHLGKVVGEPSANAVNGYGEIAIFYLPNTGLFVQISTKKWYRIDETNTDSYVMPDYPCDSQNAIEKLYEIIGQ